MKMKMSIFPSRFGSFPYIYLIYLLIPIINLTEETGIKQIIGYGMLLLFFITYRKLYFCIGKQSFTYWLALQLLILLVYSLYYNVNFIFLGFYSATFIGYYRDKAKFHRGLISLAFVLILPLLYHLVQGKTPLSSRDLLTIIPFMIVIFFSPYGIRSMNRRMELERKLDQANQQIQELVKREERTRIARDLHDTLGHTLSLLTLKSQLVQRLVTTDSERARIEAKEIEMTSRAALKQVRELVSDMRTATIAEELIKIQQILKAAEINYLFDGEINSLSISPITENIVSMCMREAVTNIVKHSGATECKIVISQSLEKMNVIVQDNGIGINQNKQFGNGLHGIKERLALIDGEIGLLNENGAILNMTIPIIRKA